MTDETVQLPKDKMPTMRLVAMPKDTNPSGSIFGGWIMAQVDVAGSIVAIQRAKGRVATVAVNSMEFHEPVFVGDVISCYAEVVKTSTTSLTSRVEVYAQRDPANLQTVKVTEAELTYVALDNNRKPRTVPEE